MTIEVERFAGGESEWDEFASAQEGFTHFHRAGWRAVMESVFGHECVYLAARNANGALVGVLPLVRVRSIVFGHYLVSMPFLNYGGPIGDDGGVRALVDEAIELARRDKVKLLEMRSSRPLAISLSASHRKITVLLDLPPNPQALQKGFDAKLRSQIRRPLKEGVSVEFGVDHVEAFYEVFSRHMRDLGTPVQSVALFREIARRFPDDSWFGVAYLRGAAVAAGCGFRFGSQFEMTWASSLREYNRESPNMLLYSKFMERAIAEGLTTFNFGRCTPGSGTHRFKMQWGGRETPLWWYTFAASGDATTPSPNDPAFSWGPRVWRRLPASIATAVGPSIVRCIP
ncbi:MAG TPA: FemAB family XrtA/PEP-CTERM system-associated protein [Gemmatimonadaceae bacterium]